MTPRASLQSAFVVGLVTALTLFAAALYSVTAPTVYEARSTYVIGPGEDLDDPESIVRSFDSLQGHGIIPTLVELLSSRFVAERAGQRLGLDEEALEAFTIRANVLSGSTTLELTVLGPEARQTAELTRGIGAEATGLFEEIYPVYQVRALDQPGVPTAPHSPRPARNLVVALPLGLLLGIALILAKWRYNQARTPPDRPEEARQPDADRDARVPSDAPADPSPLAGGSGGPLGTTTDGARRTSRASGLAPAARASAGSSEPELPA